jgi:hypothetical protein
MSEGLFHFTRQDMVNAFAKFGLGFLILEDVFSDVHPMSIAQYLTLLCTLAKAKANLVAEKLLGQVLDLAEVRSYLPASLVDALRAIYRSGEFLELPLLCLRAAVDCMETAAPAHWKSFT